ncbi:hypothetical protein D9758_003870 [Tetrapyrgos nigripes]|uniref:glucan endo-1,3-beta-D-glucosidase n=1 Tax=Tetrapyrgos nigripes TaxID=182062 RepID=A0A8H5GLH7_9AGAR|nr:hypothetical protein D9758_003870 [Tetrapyrgos nigripes]
MLALIPLLVPVVLSGAAFASLASVKISAPLANFSLTIGDAAAQNCFPALGFKMPSAVPSSTNNWWCDQSTEYAFLGFSYEVTACQSRGQLIADFANIRKQFNGRYVRMYGACDRDGFYDDIVEAAWEAGIGVHALIWFGFDGGNIWQARCDSLVNSLWSNPKAKFVTRVVQFGSEPMFDSVLSVGNLAAHIWDLKGKIAALGIPITVSEMAYGYTKNNGALPVMSAIDIIDAHMLPFFAQDASTATQAWPIVTRDVEWFIQNGQGKKLILSQNGWPSVSYPGVEANSAAAVADVQNENDYFNLLDFECSYFKTLPGGVGWFAHIYSDSQEPGYGILGTNGQPKFNFNPRTSC